MKKTKISIAMSVALLASNPVIASDYAVVVAKESNQYTHKPVSTLPTPDEGVPATVKNITTNDTDSGDIMKSGLFIEAEDGHEISINTTVTGKNPDMPIIGTWSSNIALSFDKNDKTGAEFTLPDYDGDIILKLKIEDSLYSKVLESIVIESEVWTTTDAEYSDWTITNIDQDWSPELSTGFENELVDQTRIVDKERTKQEKEEREKTGETRNDGTPQIEVDNDVVESRQDYGTKEYWEKTDPYVVTDWTVTEVFQDWNPDASTVYENTTVDQSREVKKERVIIDQEVRPATGDIRQVGSQKSDTTVETEYRKVTGELEYWENIGEVTCTEWMFDRYDPWTPAASDYDRDQSVDQTRKMYESRECSGQQYRPATDEYRTANEETEYQETEESRTVNGTKIDLNDWETKDVNGNWSVSNDGTYAYQSINGNSTIFESKATNYNNTVIKGRMRVRADAGDDDYIGMVFGMTSSENFYLWSWKKGNQGVGFAGHFLAHVTGGVDAIDWAMEVDKAGYDALDSNKSTTIGWSHGTYYDFEIKYTTNKIEVSVEGSKVLEASGSFPAGKIGFYNLSQGSVEYYKVTEESID